MRCCWSCDPWRIHAAYTGLAVVGRAVFRSSREVGWDPLRLRAGCGWAQLKTLVHSLATPGRRSRHWDRRRLARRYRRKFENASLTSVESDDRRRPGLVEVLS